MSGLPPAVNQSRKDAAHWLVWERVESKLTQAKPLLVIACGHPVDEAGFKLARKVPDDVTCKACIERMQAEGIKWRGREAAPKMF